MLGKRNCHPADCFSWAYLCACCGASWLFVQCYVPEEHRTDFVILCAREPQKGPLAIIRLKHHLCYGFHGTFVPFAFFDDSVDGTTVRNVAPPELRAKL